LVGGSDCSVDGFILLLLVVACLSKNEGTLWRSCSTLVDNGHSGQCRMKYEVSHRLSGTTSHDFSVFLLLHLFSGPILTVKYRTVQWTIFAHKVTKSSFFYAFYLKSRLSRESKISCRNVYGMSTYDYNMSTDSSLVLHHTHSSVFPTSRQSCSGLVMRFFRCSFLAFFVV
jgi:hypothetical protein